MRPVCQKLAYLDASRLRLDLQSKQLKRRQSHSWFLGRRMVRLLPETVVHELRGGRQRDVVVHHWQLIKAQRILAVIAKVCGYH